MKTSLYHLNSYCARTICFSLIILFSCSPFYGQKSLDKANLAFDHYEFIDSRAIYLKVVSQGHRSAQIFQHLGDTYYFNADLKNAQQWYKVLFEEYDNDGIEPKYYFRYAQSLKNTGEYQRADSLMARYHTFLSSRGKNTISQAQISPTGAIDYYTGLFELTPAEINSEQFDFAPSFYKKGLVFSSNRKKRAAVRNINKWDNESFFDLYVVKSRKRGKKVKPFDKILDTKFNESTAVFSKDGKTVFFTRNNYDGTQSKGSDSLNLLKLYSSRLTKGKWGPPVELPFNSHEYSVAHPALSPDEKTLYFASDMPGGYGLSDLYKADILPDGRFGTPINLGSKVNTSERETFPFMSENGDLYFSSDGHPGLGGLDVLISPSFENQAPFHDCINLGSPINTAYDDHTFILDQKTASGFFASNREGGLGGDDIYAVKRIKDPDKPLTSLLQGAVLNQENEMALEEVEIKLLTMDGKVLAQTKSDIDGSFSFGQIKIKNSYVFAFSKEGYEPNESVIDIEARAAGSIINEFLYLKPKKRMIPGEDLNDLLDIKPIYFDLDKWNIRKDAAIELEKVIAAMQKYPGLKIEVRSHTDSRATKRYNNVLSQKRSNSTVQYLIEKGGISQERLSAKGFGESQLVNHCSDGVKCDEALHQSNRRAEFIIMPK